MQDYIALDSYNHAVSSAITLDELRSVAPGSKLTKFY